MRKRLITPISQSASLGDQSWLDVESIAVIEVTSEDEDHPIDSALRTGEKRGWRAVEPGKQTIRLIFDQPQRLKRLWLVFEETEKRRTQEFVLRWSSDGGQTFREVVRQQWSFSPPGTVRETEDYVTDLYSVKVLELVIVPDISGGQARASLLEMRLA